MHINYKYILNYLEKNLLDNGRVLDLGCGKGQIVIAGKERGFDIYGADVFYKDGRTKKNVEEAGIFGTLVKEIVDKKIDFPDNYFDIVFSNQVYEHVDDLNTLMSEVQRVLKPGGVVLSLFPVSETWWEGHFGIPFLHNFSTESKFRFLYAYFWRLLGFGYHHASRSKKEWAKYVCKWVDDYTCYRPLNDINYLVDTYFSDMNYIEPDYIQYRLEKTGKAFFLPFLKSELTKWLFVLIYRKRAGIIFTAKKDAKAFA